ncbi:hypothetical protein [Nakamurella aerolata]|uniref:Uncharacterized protein n=1 Tax=Nakamurella aerolata TaxID=1656892 RepID=A0A849AEM9_9ACTN|nr:hypothetical protein [Nakamurella aerolata]NNG36920.1 hypothetical protein [Nakamurella aerolata]
MTIPNFMPLLRKGIGKIPAEGGCLVQVASYLADGLSWTDQTPCVHPVLRSLAIAVNDRVSDAVRPTLAPLAVDLVGTGPGPKGVEGQQLSVRLAVWFARQVLRESDQVSLRAIETAEAWADEPTRRNAHAAANAARTARAAANTASAAGGTAANTANTANTAARAAAYAAASAAASAATSAANFAAASAAANTASAAGGTAATSSALVALLTGAIAEHRRLTGHQPEPIDPERQQYVLETLGVGGDQPERASQAVE